MGLTHSVVFAAGVDQQESIVEQVTVSADPEAVLTGLIDSISRAFGWLDSAVLTVAANALLDPSSLEMFDREPGALDDGDIPLAALLEDRSGSAVLINIQAFGRSDGRFLLTTSLRHITTVVSDGFPPGLGMDYLVAALPVEIRENSACSSWSFTLDAAGRITRELELRAAVAAANLPTAPDPARPVFACFSDDRVRYVVRDRAENGSMSDRRREMSPALPGQYGVLNDVAAISPEAPPASLEVGS